MIGSKQEIASMQSDFYRVKYTQFMRAMLVSVVIMVMLLCGIIYFILFRAPTQYYATTTDGQIIPLSAMQT